MTSRSAPGSRCRSSQPTNRGATDAPQERGGRGYIRVPVAEPVPVRDRSAVRLEKGCAVPAPVDAVVSDARSSQFHDFDQVDLFPLGSLPRVLPDKGSLVEHELAGAIPPHQVVRPALGAPDEEG